MKWKLPLNVNISLQIFNTYMQCNLGAPDGIRKAEGEDGGEEIGETEEDDRLRFKVILIHSLVWYVNLLNNMTKQVVEEVL